MIHSNCHILTGKCLGSSRQDDCNSLVMSIIKSDLRKLQSQILRLITMTKKYQYNTLLSHLLNWVASE